MTREERIKRQIKYHQDVEKAWALAKESGEEVEFIRAMVLKDVYFLLYYVLERKDICYEEWWENETVTIEGEEVRKGKGDFICKDENGENIYDPEKGYRWRYYRPFLFERCGEVQAHPDGYLDIWSRDHYKSTIISYAMTIQEILRNPEITICIYSYNATLAQKLLGQIRNSLEGNQLLLACFPDILFKNTNVLSYKDEDGETHKMVWSNDCFNVKRKGNPKEHTVEASGLVVGQKIGGHYNLLIYDDTVVPESVFTKQQIEKTTSQFEMSLNTGSTANMRIRVIGTRYALGDTYEQILKDKTVKLRQYPCYDENGESRLYSDVILKWKLSKMHGSVVATQMYCDPQANSVFQFDMDWIPTRLPRTEIKKDFYNWYIICDPASKVSDDADNTVFIVVGVIGKGEDKRFLVADLIRDKLSLERKQKILFDLVSEFTNSRSKPTVFYERVSMQSDIQHYQSIMNQTGYHFTILEASGKPKINYGMTSTGNNLKYKDLRISALQPLLKQGMISFVEGAIHENWRGEQEDMLNSFFEEEYAYYPNSKNDDVLDALSRIADLDVGIQMTGCDINEIRRKKEKKKGEHTIDYFSEDRYQPF